MRGIGGGVGAAGWVEDSEHATQTRSAKMGTDWGSQSQLREDGMGAWRYLDAETQASQPAGPRPHPCGFTFITPDPLLHHDVGVNCEGTALP